MNTKSRIAGLRADAEHIRRSIGNSSISDVERERAEQYASDLERRAYHLEQLLQWEEDDATE